MLPLRQRPDPGHDDAMGCCDVMLKWMRSCLVLHRLNDAEAMPSVTFACHSHRALMGDVGVMSVNIYHKYIMRYNIIKY